MPQTTTNNPVIIWFRQDLRLADNPALHHALALGRPVICLYIRDEISPGIRPLGAAQKWWLHHSLTSLAADLSTLGGQLILLSGPASEVIMQLAEQTGAQTICWNRRYGEAEQAVDRQVKSDFPGTAKSYQAMLLHEPSQVRTGSDRPYKVYTPFWKKLSAGPPPRAPFPRPERIDCWSGDELAGDRLDDWQLLPKDPDWAQEIAATWRPGEAGAAVQVSQFTQKNIENYGSARDFPGPDMTARLSPHLRFGEVSPYQLWQASFPLGGATAAAAGARQSEAALQSRETWRKQLVWREFSYHLLQEWPHLDKENFSAKFDQFPWLEPGASLTAWQKGQTGYPIVDAGMRQLYQTGWMHNRVRMIVGSFLVKHLLIDWRAGEQWFWDTLVDGDPAINSSQWQWVAGCGADAAPYFRVFNPILQAQKFDPDGTYIYRFVPELAQLEAKYLAAPWQAPAEILDRAGVQLGTTYPNPIVDHQQARNRALDALHSLQAPNLEG
ncbi:MAG: deoxyribodipyrimidine photo-lyase [Rhizobiaceae bacterium]